MSRLFTLILGFSLCLNVLPQAPHPRAARLAHFLGNRNARILGCDSLAPKLELIYLDYFLSVKRREGLFPVRRAYRYMLWEVQEAKRRILTLLNRKGRRIFRRQVRMTGSILLVRGSPV